MVGGSRTRRVADRAHRAYSHLERVRRCRTRVYASRPCPPTSTIHPSLDMDLPIYYTRAEYIETVGE